MRTVLMALVLGLICTTQSYAQPEVIQTDAAAPPAPPAPVTQEAVVDPAPETVVVEKTVKPAPVVADPVCINGTCNVRKIQPVRNLVVQPIVRVVKNTACKVQQIRQSSCQRKVRVQRFRQCRFRLFKRRCR